MKISWKLGKLKWLLKSKITKWSQNQALQEVHPGQNTSNLWLAFLIEVDDFLATQYIHDSRSKLSMWNGLINTESTSRLQ